MTENKRFIVIDDGLDFMVRDTVTGEDLIDADGVADVLNYYEQTCSHYEKRIRELKNKLTRTKVLLSHMEDKYAGLLKLVHGFEEKK